MQYDISVITKDNQELPKVKQLIEAHGGKLISEREVRERPLSYPIGKLKQASYASFVVAIEPAKMVELHRALNLSEAITRALVTHYRLFKPLMPEVAKQAPSVPEPSEPKPQIIEVKPAKVVAVAESKPQLKKLVKPAQKVTRVAAVSEKDRLKRLDEELAKLLKE